MFIGAQSLSRFRNGWYQRVASNGATVWEMKNADSFRVYSADIYLSGLANHNNAYPMQVATLDNWSVGYTTISQFNDAISPKWDSVRNKPGMVNSVNGSSGNVTVPYDRYYNASGQINQNIKHWVGTITPSSNSGQTIDISSAGFGTVLATFFEVRGSGDTPVWVKVTGQTTSQLTISISQANTNLINILGSLVLLGGAYIPATVSGLTINVHVIGY